jgi:hypothetical protein
MTGLSRPNAPALVSDDEPPRGAEVVEGGGPWSEAPPTLPPMAGMRRSGVPGSENFAVTHDPELARTVGARVVANVVRNPRLCPGRRP